MKIKVSKLKSVYLAQAFDIDGNEIARITAFSKANARQLLEEKLGIRKKTKPLENQKKGKGKIKKHYSGSIMRGLLGITSARNWKKIK